MNRYVWPGDCQERRDGSDQRPWRVIRGPGMIGWVAGGVPTPWPRLRDSWWVFGLAAVALGLFTGGVLFGLRCSPRRCHPTGLDRLFDLNAIGSLPRLF